MSEKFENQFHHFSKFGDSKSDGTTITLSQSDKWMKQAKVIDGKTCTTTDTGIAFKKFKTQRLGLSEYTKFIDELASTKKLNAENIRKSMTECGAPGTHSNAAPKLSSKTLNMIMRLTDPNNYTGIHKCREIEDKSPVRLKLRGETPVSGRSKPRSPYSTNRERRERSPAPPSNRQSAKRPVVRYEQNATCNKRSSPVRPASNRRS